MNFIKKFLFKILGKQRYLLVLHRAFYLLYDMRFLKNKQAFKYHYAVKKIIQKDFIVLDIGANLGYFAKIFSRHAVNGKVICLEPIPAFFNTLTYFLGNKKNTEIHNFALGNENGQITMVLPETNGFIRTGLPHISKSKEVLLRHKTQEVEIKNASDFISNFPHLDYIKCDIEGYENIVFEGFKSYLMKVRPIIQIEIGENNISQMLRLFTELNYLQYGIANFSIILEKGDGTQQEPGDYLFVPAEKKEYFELLIK